MDRLDALLSEAAPPIAPRCPELRNELGAVVADAEAAASRPRRRWRTALLAGGAAIAVLGIGAGATAGGWVDLIPRPSSGDWSREASAVQHSFQRHGAPCTVTYSVVPDEASGARRHVAATTWRTTLSAAQAFLEQADLSTIDLDAAVSRLLANDDATRARLIADGVTDLGPSYRSQSRFEQEESAFGAELWERLSAALSHQGLDPSLLLQSSSSNCGAAR